jgi:ribonuclease BN (tRNA processing enzyme)
MRLTILGSGTCVPSGRRNSSGYFVEFQGLSLKLDAGAGSAHALGRYSLPWEDLAYQFVSHFHLDHAHELASLLFTMKYGRSRPRTAPLRFVGPRGLDALLRGMADLYRIRLLDQSFPVEICELDPGEALSLPGGALRVDKTPHTAESLAVRVELGGRSLGYTGDTGPSDALADFFRGVDLLICECSFWEDNRGTSHLTADQVAELAQASGAARLVATHFYFNPDDYDLRGRLAARYQGEIFLAEDGLQIDL